MGFIQFILASAVLFVAADTFTLPTGVYSPQATSLDIKELGTIFQFSRISIKSSLIWICIRTPIKRWKATHLFPETEHFSA